MNNQLIPITVPTPYAIGPVHFYIYQKNDDLLLIDAGVDTEEAWRLFQDKLAECGYALSQLKAVLLTHHHVDHIGLVNRISNIKDIPVYIHHNGIPRVTRDKDFLERRVSFFDALYKEMGCGQAGRDYFERAKRLLVENEHQKICADVVAISEGDRIPGFENLEIIETPGHAPDHLAIYDRTNRWAFTGDLILEHVSSNAFVEPDRHWQRMQTLRMHKESLLKARGLEAEVLYPGHGPFIGNPSQTINFRLDRMEQKLQRILNVFEEGEWTAFELAKKIYPMEHKQQFTLVMSEIIGHLDVLEDENKIKKHLKEGIWRYSGEKS